MKIFGESLQQLVVSHNQEFGLIWVDKETIVTTPRCDLSQVFINLLHTCDKVFEREQ